jgi:glycosyltransferase involved in cell wall biosynthesis
MKRRCELRVAFDARWYNDSGVGTYVAELLKAISALQKNFELLIYEDPRNPIPELNGTAVERISVASGKYSLSSQIELAWRCKRDAVDVFHSPFYVLPFAAPCPMVLSLHDLIPFLFEIYPEPKQSLVKAGHKTAARRSAHIVTVSKQTATDVQSILKVPSEKVSVIHNAVSPEHFHPSGKTTELEYLEERYRIRPPYVLAASARNWRTKNLVSALRALSLASWELQSDFQTVVFGPAEGIAALGGWQAWRELTLVPTGYVPVKDLAILFRHARVFIFPSLYEGFGFPVLEAMSCGCPVITSNAGSLAEVAGDGAQTFDPSNVSGMADAIKTLFRNPDESQRWRERGLSRASDFSWRKAAEQTISVYYHAHRQLSAHKDSLTSLG